MDSESCLCGVRHLRLNEIAHGPVILLLPSHILQTAQVLVYSDMVAHICHVSTQGVEAGELGAQGQP